MINPLSVRFGGSAKRLLAHRGLWKEVNYAFAIVTYLCSCLFFVVGLRELIASGATMKVTDDLLVALWFLLQGVFLFALTWVVERRRQDTPIGFPDRRNDR